MNGQNPNPGQSFNFLSGAGGQAFQNNRQREGYQSKIDDLMRQLQFGQMQGMNPMQMAGLQQQMMGAQRDMGNWQQQQYGQQMGRMSQAGPGMVGGGPGNRSQLQSNPYLEMLLRGSLGMGGGPGAGGGYGPQIG